MCASVGSWKVPPVFFPMTPNDKSSKGAIHISLLDPRLLSQISPLPTVRLLTTIPQMPSQNCFISKWSEFHRLYFLAGPPCRTQPERRHHTDEPEPRPTEHQQVGRPSDFPEDLELNGAGQKSGPLVA